MVNEQAHRYDPDRYIPKERIYTLLGLVLTGAVVISTGLMFVGQAIFYPLEQGIRLEARVGSVAERYADLRETQREILSTLKQNTSILVVLKREIENVNRYGSDAWRRKTKETEPYRYRP